MILYKQADATEELRQILALQQENLPNNVEKASMGKEGFVTVEHAFELLKKMNEAFPHTLAKHNGKVVGYALSMHPKFGGEIAILKSMFEEIRKKEIRENFMVMGQICIAKSHRKKGIFRGLYEHMSRFTKPAFSIIITEVDVRNERSLKAHETIGFRECSRYSSDGRVWSLLMLK